MVKETLNLWYSLVWSEKRIWRSRVGYNFPHGLDGIWTCQRVDLIITTRDDEAKLKGYPVLIYILGYLFTELFEDSNG